MKMISKLLGFGLLTAVSALSISCKEETLPKPKAYLRLDYTLGNYKPFDADCPYTFAYNEAARVKNKGECNYVIEYPKMRATVYLTYKPVNNNLEKLLKDAEKLTYEHVIKADDINSQPFVNAQNKVYGMFSQVGGDAATNAQFYVTDSTSHFLTASMYFYAKPNYDSVMPAASYIKEDMKTIMETIKWKK
jgi:gliding motility-associated lipoprotein GldD